MDATPQPTLNGIEDHFVALTEGRLSRDEVDRWAAWWVSQDSLDRDDFSWWALSLLYGIDLPAGDGGYLHTDEQVRCRLTELRRRRME